MDSTSQTVATWIAAIAAAFAVVIAWWAARWAKKIGEKQNEINESIKLLEEKQTDAEHFVELSVQGTLSTSIRTVSPQFWDLVVKSVGDHTVYLTRYYFQTGIPKLLDYAAVPPDGYQIPISRGDFDSTGVLVLTIEFEDYRQTKYKSVHTIILPKQDARLEIRSKKKEDL